jgi:beta-xylosidase
LAVWNYSPPEQAGPPKTVTLQFKGANPHHVLISRVDADHGDIHHVYAQMNNPTYPTQKQIQQLQHAAELPAPEAGHLDHGQLTLTLPSYGLAVVELK